MILAGNTLRAPNNGLTDNMVKEFVIEKKKVVLEIASRGKIFLEKDLRSSQGNNPT